MKRLVVKPEGWPCKLGEVPIGLFLFNDTLAFRNQYGDEIFIVETGEAFWGGTKTYEDRRELVVQPCKYVWEEYEARK